jgi:AcrR family transcriptional regulator
MHSALCLLAFAYDKYYCYYTFNYKNRYDYSHLIELVKMKSKTRRTRRCRKPKQLRARQTVEAILDSVIGILKREGFDAITTNRIAEVAGVSIGSVYQYFPDKGAIFAALHRRHIDEIDRVIQAELVEHASSSLRDLIRGLVEAMIGAHTKDPELYELLLAEVPHRADGTRDFSVRLHGVFRLAIASRMNERKRGRNLDMTVFIVTHMVEALCHGAVLRRPSCVSLADAKEEVIRAVLGYLQG